VGFAVLVLVLVLVAVFVAVVGAKVKCREQWQVSLLHFEAELGWGGRVVGPALEAEKGWRLS
jgi:hypothetical protein